MAEPVKLTIDDGVARLQLDAPPVNAIDLGVTEQVGGALDRLAQAPDVMGLVVTGIGRAFSAGVNFKVVPGYDRDQKRAMVRNINRMVMRLYSLPWPVVAAINGPAVGGGMVLALACDFRLAAAGARFALGEVTAGIPFPAVPLIVLEDTLDAPVRRELALTGRTVDADEARRLRIVDELAELDSLVSSASARVRALAVAPGYARIKSQLRAPALARMTRVVASNCDPMLDHWV